MLLLALGCTSIWSTCQSLLGEGLCGPAELGPVEGRWDLVQASFTEDSCGLAEALAPTDTGLEPLPFRLSRSGQGFLLEGFDASSDCALKGQTLSCTPASGEAREVSWSGTLASRSELSADIELSGPLCAASGRVELKASWLTPAPEEPEPVDSDLPESEPTDDSADPWGPEYSCPEMHLAQSVYVRDPVDLTFNNLAPFRIKLWEVSETAGTADRVQVIDPSGTWSTTSPVGYWWLVTAPDFQETCLDTFQITEAATLDLAQDPGEDSWSCETRPYVRSELGGAVQGFQLTNKSGQRVEVFELDEQGSGTLKGTLNDGIGVWFTSTAGVWFEARPAGSATCVHVFEVVEGDADVTIP